MTGTLLHCENVVKRFGSLAAVDGVSLAVEQGEVVGIGGPNGAGKTTFFDAVTGITPLSDGRVLFDGADITALSAERICRLGIARTFQLNAAFDSLTVRENVDVAACFSRTGWRAPGFRPGREAQERTEEALAFVGLAGRANEPAAQLPVLERKLLMIAGAIATKPRILFLDEPVGGLTAAEIDRVMQLVLRLRERGMTIVLIEHVMRFLLELSSTVVIMHHGKVIFRGPPRSVPEDPTVIATYLGEDTRRRLTAHFGQAEMRTEEKRPEEMHP